MALVKAGESLALTLLKIAKHVLLLWFRRNPEAQAERLARLGVDGLESMVAQAEAANAATEPAP